MELISFTLLAGASVASGVAGARAEKLVNAVEGLVRNVLESTDRLVVSQNPKHSDSADLTLE